MPVTETIVSTMGVGVDRTLMRQAAREFVSQLPPPSPATRQKLWRLAAEFQRRRDTEVRASASQQMSLHLRRRLACERYLAHEIELSCLIRLLRRMEAEDPPLRA